MINNLADIAFEQIVGDYYWGKYGEFKVIIDTRTGYINATELCKLAMSRMGGPKQFSMWRQNTSSDDLISAASRSRGIPRDQLFNIVVTGRNDLRGTYTHPVIIPHVASWASPDFAIKVSDIVNAQLMREHRELIRVKNDKIDELTRQVQELMALTRDSRDEAKRTNDHLVDVKDKLYVTEGKLDDATAKLDTATVKIENMAADNRHLITEVNAISTRLKVSAEDRVPKHSSADINEAFSVYHIPGTLKYKTISCQGRYFRKGMTNCIDAGYTQCIFYSDSPNAVNLKARVRTALQKKGIGKMSIVNIDLEEGHTTEDLLIIIRAAESEKRNV